MCRRAGIESASWEEPLERALVALDADSVEFEQQLRAWLSGT
jgi:hypothetical protein